MFMFNVKTNEKVHWIGLTRGEMRKHVAKLGQPHFRADQIYNWIYSGKIKSFQSMANIPKSFRTILDQTSGLHPLSLVKITGQNSSLTRKFLFRLSTGEMIESVLMKNKKGLAKGNLLALAWIPLLLTEELHVNTTAQAYLRPDEWTWVIIGDLSQIEQGIRDLNLGYTEVLTLD